VTQRLATLTRLAVAAISATASSVLASQTKPKATPPPAARNAPAAAPNVVVLVVSDFGWQDLSVPLYRDTTDANRRYRTRAIARLAASGVTFTDAYAASPVGTPTHVALLTGRSPATTRVTYETPQRDIDAAPTVAAFSSPAWNLNGLSALASAARTFNAPTLPSLLHAAGYRTFNVGTTEWSAPGTSGSDPKAIGFDASVAGGSSADSVALAARRLMDGALTAKKPFFLYATFSASRADSAVMTTTRDPDLEDAIDFGLDSASARYAARLAGIDRAVGNVLSYLDDTQQSDRTLVILLSDNGGVAVQPGGGPRVPHNAPLRSGKGSAYEGGVRIPLIVRWPGVAKRGFRSATPVSVVDLFPTILRAAKITAPPALKREATAADLRSTLDNTSPAPYERPLFWHMPHLAAGGEAGAEPFSAVRVGKWKLIYFYSGSRYELYDLLNDIGESRELSLRMPEVASSLSETLRRLLMEADAQTPIDRAYGRPLTLPGKLLVPTPAPP
jgi:arylsulfatase A-like enzyme